MFTIGMIIFPGMTALDFEGPHDVLARMPDTQMRVLAAVDGPVRTDIGGFMLPDTTFADAPYLDMLFIGGGPGINSLMEDDVTIEFLNKSGAQAKWITSVCTGALVLGAAGLLRGYKAATHWTAMEALRPLGAEPTAQRVVVDRNRITGGGVTAGIDFALSIVEILHGAPMAQTMQLAMEYDPQPPFDSGSPQRAAAQTVDKVRSMMANVTAERIRLAQAVAERRGW